ncbi:hypothetical protein [Leptospira perdikensis]|uniref:Glycosyltransferase RgtA/B/C/D-like domain-containing protein n=1 Tax=Leptospira perdikensis TaxID=2484948 RepID=A0A4R9JK10_9LEPT|nr:hypothetical protein [Leptospira perdikensis]TGL45810.1 hypothetical protein EHQ49_00020 [Leptospira perdikensis]
MKFKSKLTFFVLVAAAVFLYYFILYRAWGESFFYEMERFGDNSPFSKIFNAILSGSFIEVKDVVVFWGYPIICLFFSTVTTVNFDLSLIFVNLISAGLLFSILKNLYNEFVAICFNIYSIDWIQRVLIGGSEPTFLLFVFLSIFLYRRNYNLYLIGFLIGLSYTVRPLGIFLLFAIGLDLLLNRKIKEIFFITLSFCLVFFAYHLYLNLMLGDSFANYNNYQKKDWDSRLPVSFPFFILLKGLVSLDTGLLNKVKLWAYFLVSLVPLIYLLVNHKNNRDLKAYRVELVFGFVYFLFLVSYNTTFWIAAIYPRIFLPIAPIAIFILFRGKKHITNLERFSLWAIGVVMIGVAAISTVGVQNLSLIK